MTQFTSFLRDFDSTEHFTDTALFSPEYEDDNINLLFSCSHGGLYLICLLEITKQSAPYKINGQLSMW